MLRSAILTTSSVVLIAMVGSVGTASAATPAWWDVSASATPTHLAPGGQGRIDIGVSDIGDVGTDGEIVPIVVTGTVPQGAVPIEISASAGLFDEREPIEGACELATLSCKFSGAYLPFERLEVSIKVTSPSSPGVYPITASVSGGEPTGSGGEVPSLSVSREVTVSSQAVSFGVERYELTPENEGGAVDAQAGSHPFQLTADIALNQTVERDENPGPRFGKNIPEPAGPPKDLSFALPAGVVGNVVQTPQCTAQQFSTRAGNEANLCPADTAVGVAQLTFGTAQLTEPAAAAEQPLTVPVPIFNLVPSTGEPARFGFEYEERPVFLDTSVRTGGDYGVTVTVRATSFSRSALSAARSRSGVCRATNATTHLGGLHVSRKGTSNQVNPATKNLYSRTQSRCLACRRSVRVHLPNQCRARCTLTPGMNRPTPFRTGRHAE